MIEHDSMKKEGKFEKVHYVEIKSLVITLKTPQWLEFFFY